MNMIIEWKILYILTLFFQVMNFVVVHESSIVICKDIWTDLYSHTSKIVYKVVASCIQFVLPVLLVFTLYVSIYVKLRNRPQVKKCI